MLQSVSRKFRSGCMMLMREQENHLSFLGSAFLVHQDGYLLTAAHLVANSDNLMIVPSNYTNDFIPMTFERVAAMPASVVSRDRNADVALLKLEQDISISVPDDFLGATDHVTPGTSIMSLGYSFGHEQLHAILNYSGVVTGKIRSPNSTGLILFDKMIYDGDRGGPLVHVADGHIMGVVSGRFEPEEFLHGSQEWDRPLPSNTSVSYAVAIEYGIALMEAEGLFAH